MYLGWCQGCMKWEGTKGDGNGTLELAALEACFQVCLVTGEAAPCGHTLEFSCVGRECTVDLSN